MTPPGAPAGGRWRACGPGRPAVPVVCVPAVQLLGTWRWHPRPPAPAHGSGWMTWEWTRSFGRGTRGESCRPASREERFWPRSAAPTESRVVAASREGRRSWCPVPGDRASCPFGSWSGGAGLGFLVEVGSCECAFCRDAQSLSCGVDTMTVEGPFLCVRLPLQNRLHGNTSFRRLRQD